MAEPSFYGEGTAPSITDPQLRLLVKQLGVIQNIPGSFATNNPSKTDTRRIILNKILKALRGEA